MQLSASIIAEYDGSIIVLEAKKKGENALVLPGDQSDEIDTSSFQTAERAFYEKVCPEFVSLDQLRGDIEKGILGVQTNNDWPEYKNPTFIVDLTDTYTGDALHECYACEDRISDKRVFLLQKDIVKYVTFDDCTQRTLNKWMKDPIIPYTESVTPMNSPSGTK